MRVWAAVRVQHGIAGSSVVASAFLIFLLVFFIFNHYYVFMPLLCWPGRGGYELSMASSTLLAWAASAPPAFPHLN